MRNPEEIDEILKLISEIWHRNPELRLCQLIGNCFRYWEDYYYIEDDKLQDELTKYLKELNLVEKFIKQRKE